MQRSSLISFCKFDSAPNSCADGLLRSGRRFLQWWLDVSTLSSGPLESKRQKIRNPNLAWSKKASPNISQELRSVDSTSMTYWFGRNPRMLSDPSATPPTCIGKTAPTCVSGDHNVYLSQVAGDRTDSREGRGQNKFKYIWEEDVQFVRQARCSVHFASPTFPPSMITSLKAMKIYTWKINSGRSMSQWSTVSCCPGLIIVEIIEFDLAACTIWGAPFLSLTLLVTLGTHDFTTVIIRVDLTHRISQFCQESW